MVLDQLISETQFLLVSYSFIAKSIHSTFQLCLVKIITISDISQATRSWDPSFMSGDSICARARTNNVFFRKF